MPADRRGQPQGPDPPGDRVEASGAPPRPVQPPPPSGCRHVSPVRRRRQATSPPAPAHRRHHEGTDGEGPASPRGCSAARAGAASTILGMDVVGMDGSGVRPPGCVALPVALPVDGPVDGPALRPSSPSTFRGNRRSPRPTTSRTGVPRPGDGRHRWSRRPCRYRWTPSSRRLGRCDSAATRSPAKPAKRWWSSGRGSRVAAARKELGDGKAGGGLDPPLPPNTQASTLPAWGEGSSHPPHCRSRCCARRRHTRTTSRRRPAVSWRSCRGADRRRSGR